MNSSPVNGSAGCSQGSAWEKSARQLALNNIQDLQGLVDLAQKIVTNIVTHPGDERYKHLKFSNKTIATRITSPPGALDFFLASGFVVTSGPPGTIAERDNELVYPVKILTQADIDALHDSLNWLRSTVETCAMMAEVSGAGDTRPCAEGTIQLRFANGTTAAGGFMREDTLNDVLSFAKCFFSADKRDGVVLMEPHAAAGFSQEDIGRSLQQAGLFPRAALVVSARSIEARAGAMQEMRVEVDNDLREQRARADAQRAKRIADAIKTNEARNDVLRKFQEDRERRRLRSHK